MDTSKIKKRKIKGIPTKENVAKEQALETVNEVERVGSETLIAEMFPRYEGECDYAKMMLLLALTNYCKHCKWKFIPFSREQFKIIGGAILDIIKQYDKLGSSHGNWICTDNIQIQNLVCIISVPRGTHSNVLELACEYIGVKHVFNDPRDGFEYFSNAMELVMKLETAGIPSEEGFTQLRNFFPPHEAYSVEYRSVLPSLITVYFIHRIIMGIAEMRVDIKTLSTVYTKKKTPLKDSSGLGLSLSRGALSSAFQRLVEGEGRQDLLNPRGGRFHYGGTATSNVAGSSEQSGLSFESLSRAMETLGRAGISRPDNDIVDALSMAFNRPRAVRADALEGTEEVSSTGYTRPPAQRGSATGRVSQPQSVLRTNDRPLIIPIMRPVPVMPLSRNPTITAQRYIERTYVATRAGLYTIQNNTYQLVTGDSVILRIELDDDNPGIVQYIDIPDGLTLIATTENNSNSEDTNDDSETQSELG